MLWLLLLAVLAWRTANPATLNLAQLYRSDAVVLAEVIDPETGTVSINEVLFAK